MCRQLKTDTTGQSEQRMLFWEGSLIMYQCLKMACFHSLCAAVQGRAEMDQCFLHIKALQRFLKKTHNNSV